TVRDVAAEQKLDVRMLQKVRDDADETEGALRETEHNEEVVEALTCGDTDVAAGTAWLWTRDDMIDTVDVLFVDEAGQMSLANVVAAGRAAKSLVLLGDPQQLEQPLQGSHPAGTAVSALQHVLNSAK